MSPTGPGDDARADVELRLPADSAYVSVLRTTTAGLAARLDFTIDDIEDLRIAVGEASALVLPEAEPGLRPDLPVLHAPGRADRQGRGAVRRRPTPPDYDSFAWQVLDHPRHRGRRRRRGDGRFTVSVDHAVGAAGRRRPDD